MKSIAVIVSLFATGVLSAPIRSLERKGSDADAFNYTNNINNAIAVSDVERSTDSDAFNYTNNIDNAVTANDAEEEAKPVSDLFNYTNNINNAVTVEDADGTKVILSSPYTNDVNAADAAAVLGE